VLHQAGLVAALRQLAAETHDRLGIEIDLDVRRAGLGSSSSIDDLLFGAARELLANIGKHAHATRAHIDLSARAGTVSLVVSDDGVGFDSERLDGQLASGHVGLASLRARVAGAGGRLDITRGDPSGTVVTITLPEPTRANPSVPDRAVDGREVSR
jgi:two-component system NarL family sensor kinase